MIDELLKRKILDRDIDLLKNIPEIKEIKENKDKLLQLADILIEKEVIFKDDLETIFGSRPFQKDIDERNEFPA